MEERYIQVILPLKLDWAPYYRMREGIVCPGMRVKVMFARREYLAVVSKVNAVPNMDVAKIQEVMSIESDLPIISEKEMLLWEKVADYYMCTQGEVYKAAYPAIRTALPKVSRRKEKKVADIEGLPEMTEAQKNAYNEIKKGFANHKTVLLHGVTGSGKTEIYLSLASEVLAQGKDVLYLVPEIALSRQLEIRLEKVFGEKLQIYHSARTAAARRDVANKVREGGYILLGTRSSVFLPHNNLGLVIVDEEHDSSYKQDSPAPHYNGRDTSLMLAIIHGANVLLGSATPSMESLYNSMKGLYNKVNLTERYYESAEAKVEIIDTIAERRKRGMNGSFSRKLIDKIERTLAEGGQIAILRARRSYYPALQCPECGFMPKCPGCSVSLSLHSNGRLICHHCGYSTPYNSQCPKCGAEMRGIGAGVQKIEEETAALFPEAKIARLDSDSNMTAGYTSKVIKDFAAGKTDILIGTQVLTKGFDFSGLSLVAVIGADSLLGLQDFRADEKAIQLLRQFKGRTGRRGGQGTLVIQTAQPEHPLYKELQYGNLDNNFNQDYLNIMMQERQTFLYPPFTRLINIVLKDRYSDRADRMANALAQELNNTLVSYRQSHSTIMPILPRLEDMPALSGPYTPPVSMVAGSYIRMLRISLSKDKRLKEIKLAIKSLIKEFELSNKYDNHIVIDVDPI